VTSRLLTAWVIPNAYGSGFGAVGPWLGCGEEGEFEASAGRGCLDGELDFGDHFEEDVISPGRTVAGRGKKFSSAKSFFLRSQTSPLPAPAMVRMSASARRKGALRQRDNHRSFSFLYRGAVLGEAFLIKQEYVTPGISTY